MTDHQLLKAWFELECIEIADDGRIRQIDGSTCDGLEQLAIVKLADGQYLRLFSIDTDIQKLESLRDEYLHDNKSKFRVLKVLKSNDIRREHAYIFDTVPNNTLADTMFVGDGDSYLDECVCIRHGDTDERELVARAWSVRRNDRSAQVAVEVYSNKNREAYMRRVITAWVEHQIGSGVLPILVFRDGNEGLESVSKSLKAKKFAEVLSYH